MAMRDPDDALIPIFRFHAVKNDAKSLKEGRPIFDDMEVCEVRIPGSRNYGVFPATAFSHWKNDPLTGEQVKVTFAERFPRQYRQFKEQAAQTKSGTPLAQAPFLTEARRAELRALNIYTVEQLANVDGQELKNLGQGGRELKNAAMEYISEGLKNAPNLTMAAELDALKARNEILEEDLKAAKDRAAASAASDGEFDNMTLDMLRDFIKTHTGHAPHGSIGRKTLVRMASEAQQKVG